MLVDFVDNYNKLLNISFLWLFKKLKTLLKRCSSAC